MYLVYLYRRRKSHLPAGERNTSGFREHEGTNKQALLRCLLFEQVMHLGHEDLLVLRFFDLARGLSVFE